MSQTKAQLISDLVQALAFTATASAPTNGMFLSDTNELAISTNSTQHLTVDSSGNVGIGTTSPSVLLHVSSSGDTIARVTSADGNSAFLDLGDASDPDGGRIVYDSGSNLTFSTASTERMRINSSGRVGIGTTSPDEILHVANTGGGASILIETDASSGGNLLFGDDSSNTVGRVQYVHSDNSLRLHTNGSEQMRIDSSGRLLVGTSSSQNVGFAHAVQIEGTAGTTSSLILIRNSNDTFGPHIDFAKTRGTANGSNTIVQSGDDLGNLVFRGADGTDKATIAVQIQAEVDGTPGSNDMPGRLIFSTTADGASSTTERMRIDSSGQVIIGGTSPLDSDKQLTLTSTTTSGGLGILSPNNGRGDIFFGDADDDNIGQIKYSHVDDSLTIRTNTADRLTIDSSGRLLVGRTSALNVGAGSAATVEIQNSANFNLSLISTLNGSGAGGIAIGKARGGSVVQSGDDFGSIVFAGHDGTDFETRGASITAQVDGTPGSNDMPGRLLFSTTSDGASGPTERMRIDSSGRIGIGTSSINGNAKVHICEDSTPTGGDINLNAAGLVIDNSDGNTGLTFKTPNTAISRVCFGDPEDNNVGQILYGHSDNRLTISTAGSERIRIDSSGRLLVGTTSDFTDGTGTKLQSIDPSGGQIALGRDATSLSAGFLVGRLRWYGNVGGTAEEVARISVEADDTHALNDKPGRLRFLTNGGGSSVVERMRIDSFGRVGISESSPAHELHVSDASTPEIVVEDTTNNVKAYLGSSDTNGRVGTLSNDHFQFRTNDTERMRLDTSGRLLIGTTTEGHVNADNLTVAGSANCGITIRSGTSNSGNLYFSDGTSGDAERRGSISYEHTDERMMFNTDATERMRIFSTGQTHHFSAEGVLFAGTAQGAGTTYWLFRGNRNRTSNTTGGTTVFYVWSNGNVQNTNNSFTAISDVKLKENIVDATSQWDDLKALRVRKYNFIEGETHTQIGVIAQEVETVSPGLVFETTDRDEEGNDLGTVTKGVNYSVLYMKAVKALQEAIERIETLEAKVAALEAE